MNESNGLSAATEQLLKDSEELDNFDDSSNEDEELSIDEEPFAEVFSSEEMTTLLNEYRMSTREYNLFVHASMSSQRFNGKWFNLKNIDYLILALFLLRSITGEDVPTQVNLIRI